MEIFLKFRISGNSEEAGLPLSNGDFYTGVGKFFNNSGRNTVVGNDLINFIHAADLAESPFAKFGMISKNNHLLCYSYHFFIQLGFHRVAGGYAKFKVYTVYAEI